MARLSFCLVLTVLMACSDASSDPKDAGEDAARDKGGECVDRADGYACGDGAICLDGECMPSTCGDGYVDRAAGEDCDDRNRTEGDGCDNDCRFSCAQDEECSDGNPCNGAERCIPAGFGQLCVPALAPLDCDKGEACTLYRCDPGAPSAEEACLAEPIDTESARCWRDEDSDGYPSYAIDTTCPDSEDPECGNGLPLDANDETLCGCPEGFIAAVKGSTPEDCDDDDPRTSPGAPELCGDYKDNNCDGRHEMQKPDATAILEFCSFDADQDGYPDPNEDGQLIIRQGYECACPEGMSRIQESRTTQADCDPSNKDVNPGITAYSPVAYCPGINELADSFVVTGRGRVFVCSDASVTPSFDFNCDGVDTIQNTTVNDGECGALCRPSGWREKVPSCGQDGDYLSCTRVGKKVCNSSVVEGRTSGCR